jgi:hypothetical protein
MPAVTLLNGATDVVGKAAAKEVDHKVQAQQTIQVRALLLRLRAPSQLLLSLYHAAASSRAQRHE